MKYILAGNHRAAAQHAAQMDWRLSDWIYCLPDACVGRRWLGGDELWLCYTWYDVPTLQREAIRGELAVMRLGVLDNPLVEALQGLQTFPGCYGGEDYRL